jgi:hypothetical protein
VKRRVRAFGRFWWDFVVGDDWRIALGVVLVLALGALAVASSGASDAAVTVLCALGIVGVSLASIVTSARRGRRRT